MANRHMIHLIDKDAMELYLHDASDKKARQKWYEGFVFGVMVGASCCGLALLLFLYYEVFLGA